MKQRRPKNYSIAKGCTVEFALLAPPRSRPMRRRGIRYEYVILVKAKPRRFVVDEDTHERMKDFMAGDIVRIKRPGYSRMDEPWDVQKIGKRPVPVVDEHGFFNYSEIAFEDRVRDKVKQMWG